MTGKMDKRMTLALAGAAALGGAGLGYYLYKKNCESSSESGSESIAVEVKLEQEHITWLDGIAAKYTSGDSVKALHKVVDHCMAASTDEKVAEIIFKEIRCNTCGKKAKVDYTAQLSREHVSFIDDAVAKYEISAGKDKCLRVMFEYVINDTVESSVFGG